MRFRIVDWKEENSAFIVRFAVASNKDDRLDPYTVVVAFNGEDPQLFMNKLRNHMVSHVAYVDNLKSVKSIMTDFAFTDPTVHYYENIGASDVT
jgi:hypothetical protein